MLSSFQTHFNWLVALLVLVLGAGMIFVLRQSLKWFKFLRISVFILLLFLAVEPSFETVPKNSNKLKLAILMDVSKSMGIEDPQNRITKAKSLLKNAVGELEENFDLNFFQFSQTCIRSSLKEIEKLEAKGRETQLLKALEQISREQRGENFPILVISDGSENFENLEPDREGSLAPIFTIGMGNEKGFTDLALRDLRAPDFAFKGKAVECVVEIKNVGFLKKKAPVILKEKKGSQFEEIFTKELFLDSENPQEKFEFKFTPAEIGFHEYQIEIPLQKGEIVKSNNLINFSLNVKREKLRILYLCGQPSPEYAFLRQLFKSDPSIDLVSFVILRNPENVVPVAEDQLSLIPFPAHEIFNRNLSEFDLLIFENFAYERFGISSQDLENVRRFVEEGGGGFLMIGGVNSFGLSNYSQTAIEKILPVVLDKSREKIEDGSFSLNVLQSQHPLMNLGEAALETKTLWKNMPILKGYHKFGEVKEGAQTLAAISFDGSPAIVAWEKGKGRVIAMALLSTWQWALKLSEQGSLQSGYTQFWRRLARWITSSTDLKPIQIILSESEASVARAIVIKILLNTETLKLSREFNLNVNVFENEKILEALPLTSLGNFEYRTEWLPKKGGLFSIRVSLQSEGNEIKEFKAFKVLETDLELENPFPNHALLKELSKVSGGEFFTPENFSPQILKNKIKRIESSKVQPIQKNLWTSPWLLVSIVLLLLIEWSMRRHQGGI